MDPKQFFAASRVLIVAGKGGVGKTTASATLALAAARVGCNVLLVSIDGSDSLPRMLGVEPFDYHEREISLPGLRASQSGVPAQAATSDEPGSLRVRTLAADDALVEYLHDHGLGRISNRMVASGLVDIVTTAIPGIRDLLVLGKIRQLEQGGNADLIVVDGPAAGHAITLLRSPRGLADAVSTGPIRSQAQEVLALLADPNRCQVMLVTLAEETPVNEVVDTAYSLEEDIGVALTPIVINAVEPELAGLAVDLEAAAAAAGETVEPELEAALREAARFRSTRSTLQHEQVHRLTDRLPLDQVVLPFVFTRTIGPAELDTLSTHLLIGIGQLHREAPA